MMKIFNKFEVKTEKCIVTNKYIYFNVLIINLNTMALLPHRSNL